MIAEDVRLIAHKMAAALRDADYRVETAGDGMRRVLDIRTVEESDTSE